jgi:hypothetical protein
VGEIDTRLKASARAHEEARRLLNSRPNKNRRLRSASNLLRKRWRTPRLKLPRPRRCYRRKMQTKPPERNKFNCASISFRPFLEVAVINIFNMLGFAQIFPLTDTVK